MYPRNFASLDNFKLAWTRIRTAGNHEYKVFFRHLYPSYEFSLGRNLRNLLSDVRNGRYRPEAVVRIHRPKASGVLRAITLLSLNDQVIYQAIGNIVAERLAPLLRRTYMKRTFGALYAGKNSPFFYQHWKPCYRRLNRSIESAFKQGNTVLAEFDLVSFYDLIDHRLLRSVLEARVNGEILDLLFDVCLRKWMSSTAGAGQLSHGIPQGPVTSAFIAECFLGVFDRTSFGKVKYFRYIDDIRILGRNLPAVRRALVKLDLGAKKLGLVPQAQKINVREVSDIRAELKNVPSPVIETVRRARWRITPASRRRLHRLFRNTLRKKRKRVEVLDTTRLKYLLHRMPRSIRSLRLVKPLFKQRPDLSSALSSYIRRFPETREAAEILYSALREDPVFDSVAHDYVLALHFCVGPPYLGKYRTLVRKLPSRSIEKSLLITYATSFFEVSRLPDAQVGRYCSQQTDPLVTSLLVSNLTVGPRQLPGPGLAKFRSLLQLGARSANSDFSRFCTYTLISDMGVTATRVSSAGRLVLRELGLRRRVHRRSLVAAFFRERFGLAAPYRWNSKLRRFHAEAERRCNRIEGRWDGNPSVFVLELDSFNDLLVGVFSSSHPSLNRHFTRAAARAAVPDYGQWLRNGHFVRRLPRASQRFLECHELRVEADLAHARSRRTGRPTRRIKYWEVQRLKKRLLPAYADLFLEWNTF